MRRLTAALAALGTILAICAAALTASPALAGRGPKWHLVPARPFTLDARYCGFRVHVTLPVFDEYTKIVKAADGSMTTLVTGAITATFTNLRTGEAITENLSGPGKVTVAPDGSATITEKGHNGLFFLPADARRFGLPTLTVTTGPVTESVAPNGAITALSRRGHILVNICAALR
jgi:hypothetical protein